MALLLGAVPAGAQEARAFLVLEGDPGYMTNGYLAPAFASWEPTLESAFGTGGATGIFEVAGKGGAFVLTASGRWTGFADSVSAWRSYVAGTRGEARFGPVALGADLSAGDIRQAARRQMLWAQGFLRWRLSSGVRLTLQPGVARVRFPEAGAAGGPQVPGGPPGGDPTLTSYVASARMEAWAGRGWRVETGGYGTFTEAPELGIDYRGLGGGLRMARILGNGGTVELGAAAEGFGYRAALEGALEEEIPSDDVILRGSLGVEWPLGRRSEIRARVAALHGPVGPEENGFDVYAAAGLRVTLGGVLGTNGSGARVRIRQEGDGEVWIRIRYDGAGRLYLVGDFNDWADPGVPLTPRRRNIHEARLRLEPGSYRYRVRVVEPGSESWLELPEEALVEDDGFGGENGVLVVAPTVGT